MRDGLAVELRRAVRGDVGSSAGTLALYAADASNYRHVPLAVVAPVDADDVAAALDVCRRHGAAVLPRGAGTSIGGQAVNAAVVLDFTRHMDRVVEVDAGGRRARVQPGVILDDLQAAAASHGLVFGPDPSTHSRCTLGGMIGNNACGSHSVAWGKTDDSIESLDVITYRGDRLSVGPGGGTPGPVVDALQRLVTEHGAAIAGGFPALARRVSGYNLDHLLGERGFHVARALAGSEGTCATVLEATVSLVAAPSARALTVLGFPDAATAADHVPDLLTYRPLALEGIDLGLVEALRAARPAETLTARLPPGGGWLYVETGGGDRDEAADGARRVAGAGRDMGAEAVVIDDPVVARALWRVREDGAGILTRLPGGGEAWPGWEDSAVPPRRLGAYLRDLAGLMSAHGLSGAYYGHFGEGCVHLRLDFDLATPAGAGGFRRFVEEAADLVAGYGGSLSGEHGDGQARSELLPRMYPPPVLAAFAAFKQVWDPDGAMNPGVIVGPRPLDADLRVALSPPDGQMLTRLSLRADGGDFARAARRCVGVGRCVTAAGGVMCPSWRATGEERHSTRGRARLLFEMANGSLIKGGWRSEEVREALDLCLGCKGCKRDCPVTVDMASYKAEFLSHHYQGRVRPAAHYSLGWLPLWLRAMARYPRAANAVTGGAVTAPALRRLGGIAPERSLPPVAGETFTRWFAGRPAPARPQEGRRLLLFPDTFTNFFDPSVGRAAVAVLEAAGYRVQVPAGPVCCGLTWLSTGQLGTARRVLAATARRLRPWLEAGVEVVGLEPSCTGLLRVDSADLTPWDPAVASLAQATRSLAQVLDGADDLPVSPGSRRRALAQVHCHQYAEWGFDADLRVLDRLGVDTEVLDSGCCGLAGNFGFERGHYSVSMACAERVLLPAVRRADPEVAVLADGFSCRTQIRQGSGRAPVHLAELAHQVVVGSQPGRRPS
jgi:FAD/FMN-containing dehydrogenase/Fe-S oxidoreductase